MLISLAKVVIMTDKKQPEIKVPAHLENYVETLGDRLAAEFFLAFGGSEIYLSQKPTLNSMVARAIGIEKTAELAKVIHNGHVKVPVARIWLAEYFLSQGWSIAKIARTVRADTATVRRWLGPAPASRQLSLFDNLQN